MGWWPFASSSAPSGQAPASSSKPSDLLPPTTSISEPRANAPKRLTREQQADAELEAFLASLEEGPSHHTKPPSTRDPIPHIPILPPQPSTNPTQTSVPEHPETPSDTKLAPVWAANSTTSTALAACSRAASTGRRSGSACGTGASTERKTRGSGLQSTTRRGRSGNWKEGRAAKAARTCGRSGRSRWRRRFGRCHRALFARANT